MAGQQPLAHAISAGIASPRPGVSIPVAPWVGRLLVLVVLLSGCVPDRPAPQRDAGNQVRGLATSVEQAAAAPSPPDAEPPSPAAKDAGASPLAACPPPEPVREMQTPLAAARAVETRLTGLVRARCLRGLDQDETAAALGGIDPDDLDVVTVWPNAKLPDLLAVSSDNIATPPWVGLYRLERRGAHPRARLLTLVTRTGLPDPGPSGWDVLALLRAAVIQVPGTKQPLLVVLNTYLGNSCWHAIRFAVFAPGRSPLFPREVKKTTIPIGYYCDDLDIAFDGSELTVGYYSMPGWGKSGRRIQLLPPDYVARPATLAFSVDKSLHFERRFGYVAGKHGIACLVEDWLYDDWKLAAEASSSASLAELEKAHRRFGSRRPRKGSEYSMELFPRHGGLRAVVYCDRGEKTKPCSEWPKPVDFMLTRKGQRWQIAAVKER